MHIAITDRHLSMEAELNDTRLPNKSPRHCPCAVLSIPGAMRSTSPSRSTPLWTTARKRWSNLVLWLLAPWQGLLYFLWSDTGEPAWEDHAGQCGQCHWESPGRCHAVQTVMREREVMLEAR